MNDTTELLQRHGLTKDQLVAAGVSEKLAGFYESSVRTGLDRMGTSLQNAVHDTTLKALAAQAGVETGDLVDLIARGELDTVGLERRGMSTEDATLLSFWVKLFVVYPEHIADAFECINALPHEAGLSRPAVEDPTLDVDIDGWLATWAGVLDNALARMDGREYNQLEAIAKHEKQPLLARLVKQIESETSIEAWARNLTRYSILDGYSKEDAEWITTAALDRRGQRLYGNAYGFARRDFHALMQAEGHGYRGRCRCPTCKMAAVQRIELMRQVQ